MDLTLTADEEAFRDELREWLEANHPGPSPGGGDQAEFEFQREWQKVLHEGGWAGISWPKEYGGRGATPDRAGDRFRGDGAREGARARRTCSAS